MLKGEYVFLVAFVMALVVVLMTYPSVQNGFCASDSDCVPAQCCHPTECVHESVAPKCEGVMCTMECRPGTMDCGQGHCECISGTCRVVIE